MSLNLRNLNQSTSLILKHRRISIVLLSLSIILWTISIYWSKLDIGKYGLIHGIHPLFFVAVAILIISFFNTIKRQTGNTPLLIVHLTCLVIFFNLMPIFIEGTPRFSYNYITYHHTDYILQVGHSNHQLMSYQSWPGIFYFAAILTYITGISPTGLLLYVPIILSIVNIPLAFLLYSTLSDSKKDIWGVFLLGVVFWGSPIYFLPGVLGGMMALYVITILLRFKLLGGRASTSMSAIVLIFLATTIISHLMSSAVLAITLISFYILAFGYKKLRDFTLPILFIVAMISWQFYVVGSYSLSILHSFLTSMFKYDLTVSQVHQMGFGGSEAHSQIVWIRIVSASLFTLIAILGFLYVVISKRKLTFKTALLPTWIAVNSSFVLLTAYSGEILSRSFAASDIALSILAGKNITGKFLSVLLLALLLIFPLMSIINAYGNEAYDYVSPAEIRGVEFFSSHAHQDAKIATLQERIWGIRYTKNFTRINLSPDSFDWADGGSTKDYVLIGERDIVGYTFLCGAIDIGKLRSIEKSQFYGKVYASEGFDIYKALTLDGK